jgi:hypothetical protein
MDDKNVLGEIDANGNNMAPVHPFPCESISIRASAPGTIAPRAMVDLGTGKTPSIVRGQILATCRS